MKFPKLALVPILPVSLILMAGCDSNDSPQTEFPDLPEVTTGQVRYTHAAADAPPVRFAVGETYRDSAQDFAGTSGLVTYYAGPIGVSVAVDPIVAPGADAPELDLDDAINAEPLGLTVIDDTRIDVFAVGSAEDDDLRIITLEASASFDGSDSSARVAVIHLSPDAPTVDVYVTAPDATLAGATALGTMEFGQDLGPTTVPAGDYRVRVTLAGGTDVIFDSGEIELAAGNDLVVGAIPNVWVAESADKAPIALLALGADGSGTVIMDDSDPAELRFANLSPDSDSVVAGLDIVLVDENDTPTEGDPLEAAEVSVATSLPYAEVANYQDVAVATETADADIDEETFGVLARFTGTENNFADEDASVTFAQGGIYTSFFAGEIDDLQLFTVQDSPREVANAARLRAVHGSASAGTVDIYVTTTDDIEGADPVAEEVELGSATNYFYLPAGDYFVTVTATGTTDTAIDAFPVTLANGDVFTAIAHSTPEGEFDVLVVDDAPEAAAVAAQ